MTGDGRGHRSASSMRLSVVAGAAVQHVREATLQPRLALRLVAPGVNDLAGRPSWSGHFLEEMSHLAAGFIRVVDDDLDRTDPCPIDALGGLCGRTIGQLKYLVLPVVESDRDLLPSAVNASDDAFGRFQPFVANPVDFPR